MNEHSQKTNDKSPHSTEPRPQSQEWRDQVRALVYQSFNVFNIYGREPESLESILLGFTIALEDIPLDYITRAFKDWLKTNTDMPLPANIRKDAMEWIEIDRKKQGKEMKGRQRKTPP